MTRRPAWQVWDEGSVVERIQAWVATYGQIPGAADWNPAQARALGRPDRAERFEKDGCWPYVTTVLHFFGSWNNAIRAAGFQPRGKGWPARVPPATAKLDGALSELQFDEKGEV